MKMLLQYLDKVAWLTSQCKEYGDNYLPSVCRLHGKGKEYGSHLRQGIKRIYSEILIFLADTLKLLENGTVSDGCNLFLNQTSSALSSKLAKSWRLT